MIRLANYVRVPYRGRVPLTRAGLMHRDRYRCAYCGGRAETIDHVVPRSRGGPHSWTNCVACCAKCNHRKADKLLSELGWRLRFSALDHTLGEEELTDLRRRCIDAVTSAHPARLRG